MSNRRGKPGEAGECGEPGIHGGGTGGRGGRGGEGGEGTNDVELRVDIAALEQRVESHESACAYNKKIIMWALGILISVVLGMSAQLLLIAGRQEGMASTLIDQAFRMTQISNNSNASDERLRQDIKELRDLLIARDRGANK